MLKLVAFGHPPGVHAAGWRLVDAAPRTDSVFENYAHMARIAERGKFHALFYEDANAVPGSSALVTGDTSWAGTARGALLDPKAVLPALAMLTQRIGLIGTATTTYNEPFNLARYFASLDHVSGGRAGWNLVTSQTEDEAQNFGLAHHPRHETRYARAREFFDVVTGLWDSWSDDAFVQDRASGTYFDPAGLHILRHAGEHFQVRGPLNVARPPQGHPIVAQGGSSETGRAIAAETADIVFTAQVDRAESQAFVADIKARAMRCGRAPADILVLPGILPLVADTDAEAREKYEELQSLISDEIGLRALSRHVVGIDLRQYPMSGPLPELPPSNSALGRQKLLVDLVAKGLSIRELGRIFAASTGHHFLAESPATIADTMEHWFRTGAADGFVVMPPYVHTPLERFVEKVIPELQRRGIFWNDYSGFTLRDNLGLARSRRDV